MFVKEYPPLEKLRFSAVNLMRKKTYSDLVYPIKGFKKSVYLRGKVMNKNMYTDNQKYFLKLLKTCRIKSALSQQDLAEKLSISQSAVSKIENGDRKVDVLELIEISKAIGCDPVEILKNLFDNWIDD